MSADVIDLAPRRETAQVLALRQELRLEREKNRKLVSACDAYASTLPTQTGPALKNLLQWRFEVEQARHKPCGRP